MKNTVNSKRRSKRSRVRRRRAAAALVLVCAVLGAWLIVRAFGHRQTESVVVIPNDRMLTARATPRPAPWTSQQTARLQHDVRDALAPVSGDGAVVSAIVLAADGRVLYADDADRAARPASVQKLLVADAVLGILGPDYRFHTILSAKDHDVWLSGSGDPSFRDNDLRDGANQLARAGVRSIDRLGIDTRAIQGPEINPHWNPDDAGEDYQTPTSAVSLDEDTVEFRVYGGNPGSPARVVVTPKNGLVHVSGSVMTSSADDSVIIAPQGNPDDFELSGYIPQQTEEKFWLPVHGIEQYTGSALAAMLRDAGVSVAHQPVASAAPLDSTVLWDHRSAPVTTLLAFMLVHSDNHFAEQFLRTLGAQRDRPDDAGGLAVEATFLRSRGIPLPGLHVVDGSGLSEVNRVSAMTLARVLADRDLYALLPQGGRNGTLKHYDFTTAFGRVRAKTGHLSDADSLAGYVDTAHHGRIIFAFMIDDSAGDVDRAYVQAVDRLATL